MPGDRNVSGGMAASGPVASGPVASGTAGPEARPAKARRRWSRVAGGVALAAVLAGGWAVYTGLGTTALPYRADFADAWAVGASEGGRSEQDGGGYVLTANAGWRLWKSAPFSGESAEGIVISSRVRLERGSGEFGVWCHGDSVTGDRYEFAVTGSGEASISKRHGGRSTVLHGPVQVRKSAENRVVAQCVQRGEKVALSMWLNDDLVSEAADTSGPYSPGAVGVYAAPDTAQPVQVRFRTFELRAAKG